MAGPPGSEVEVPAGSNINADQYNRYKVWAQVGVIKIASQGPVNFQSSVLGVVERITVTPICNATDCEVSGNTLKIRRAKFNMDNIIKNEERTVGVHRYRILMGTYSTDWSPASRSFCRISNQCSLADKGKFMMLLKYDEFSNRWKAVTWDSANIDKDFTTRNVDQQIRSVQ